ncbi:MAG TPA: Crp/Fnr family transcriptional regulator [Pyrinomonadaceae bacterium]|nr:Crp/Fnr family transcriptional regulator [Pyrinomonadaceae bacterium]
MSSSHTSEIVGTNRILAALSPEQYPLLFSNLQLIDLPRSKVIYGVGDSMTHCFFINSGMISLLAVTEDGSAAEISMVGNEGFIGVPALLGINKAPYCIEVQLPVKAMRVKTDTLVREFKRGGPLQELTLRYAHSLISQISQSTACNTFHTIGQRLARWLLISRDRVNSNAIPLTHEALSHMLGSSRTTVSEAASSLKAKGLIDYRRGNIQIINGRELERTACECYRMVTESINHFAPPGTVEIPRKNF